MNYFVPLHIMKHILILISCLCPLLLCGQNLLSTLDDMYTVVKGETWESIAESHGVSVEELKAANPDVKKKKLKKGTLLIIPRKPEPAPVVEEQEKPAPLIRTSIPDMKVGVLLPFSDKKMVEFYRGFLMAADSMRHRGVNLDIHTWDCGTTTEQIEALLPNLNELDVVFGPASATQIPAVADACKERGIRLVLPFWSGVLLQDNPRAYNATAPASVLYDAAVKKMMSYYPDKNYVIVHSGSPDDKGKFFTDALTQALAQRTVVPRTLEIEGNDFAYESAFNQFRDNVVVLDDSSVRSLNILLSHLKDFRKKHPQYKLSLVGFTEWQDETQTLLEDFFTSDTYIITPYYYNVLDDKVKRFQHAYEKNFRTTIIQRNPRYAALGFDIGAFFLSGISNLGDTFEQMQIGIQQDPCQNWYRFSPVGDHPSMVNTFVQFLHFTPESKIEIIR